MSENTKTTYEIARDLLIDRGCDKRSIKTSISKMAGVTYHAVRKWEEKTATPGTQAIQALAKGLGVSVNYLLGGPSDDESNRLDDEMNRYWNVLEHDDKIYFLENLNAYLKRGRNK